MNMGLMRIQIYTDQSIWNAWTENIENIVAWIILHRTLET